MATTQTPAAHETTERIVVVNDIDKMILNVATPMDAPAKNAVGSLTVGMKPKHCPPTSVM